MSWKKRCWSITSFLLCSVTLLAEHPRPTQDLVFPYIVMGGGWECDLSLVNQGAESASGQLLYFDNAGNPLAVSVNGGEPSPDTPFRLEYPTAVTFRLTGDETVVSGYSLVRQNPASERSSINGLITFRYRVDGETLQQVGVRATPLRYGAHVPFDNTLGNRTAIAVMSPDRHPVTLIRHDRYGQGVDRFQLNFGYWESNLLSAFVDQLFPSSQRQEGLLRMEASEGAYLLVLNQNNLILSTGDAFAGVVERQLQVRLSEERSWTLRLIQEGDLLIGIAQQQPSDDPVEFVTGSFAGGTLHLSLSHRTEGVEQDRACLLLATTEDLDEVSGAAFLVSAEGIADTGTFQLSKPQAAQF